MRMNSFGQTEKLMLEFKRRLILRLILRQKFRHIAIHQNLLKLGIRDFASTYIVRLYVRSVPIDG